MILAATGLQRERRIVAGPDIEAIASGGDPVRLEAMLDRLAGTASGIISIGIAGALAVGLPVGQWVVADAVMDDGESLPTDPAWTGRRRPGESCSA
jgi:adenosylhomocysteine nucleosidase